MKLLEADTVLLQYNRLRSKVKDAALEKIKAADLEANKGKQSNHIRYLQLREFYVNDGLDYIEVIFDYGDGDAPYSGSEEVRLTAQDIKAF